MGGLNRIAVGLFVGFLIAWGFVGSHALLPVVETLPAGEPIVIESPFSPLIDVPLPGPEKPDLPPPADSGGSAGRATPAGTAPESPAPITTPNPSESTANPSEFVRRIQVRSGSESGVGSATHIGDGTLLSCRHVFNRPVSSVEVDGVEIAANWVTSPGPDFSVVRTSVSGPAATISTVELTEGQPLRVVGQKTGLHTGVLSPKRWNHGYRAVICKVPTESGDSGAGVFNESGELVGVHWGSLGDEVFFTPLSVVAAMLPSAPAVAGAHSPSASPAADTKPVAYVDVPAADWCGPCRALKKEYESVKDSLGIRIEFRPVKDDARPNFPHVHVVDRNGQEQCAGALTTVSQIVEAQKRLY